MCGRCRELDRQLENFRRARRDVTDDLALSLLLEAIKEIETEKESLHREHEE